MNTAFASSVLDMVIRTLEHFEPEPPDYDIRDMAAMKVADRIFITAESACEKSNVQSSAARKAKRLGIAVRTSREARGVSIWRIA